MKRVQNKLMNKQVINLFFSICIIIGSQILSHCNAQNTNEHEAIKKTILEYGKALNEADVEGILAVFSNDGVFMPAKLPTATGQLELKKAFQHEFETIKLDIKVVFDEVAQHGNFAYVRTRSDGTIKILAKNITVPTDNYRAFFVLQKIKNEWRIIRLMFNFKAP